MSERRGAAPARSALRAAASLAALLARQLRLTGSRCCVGRADAAWQLTRDRASQRPG